MNTNTLKVRMLRPVSTLDGVKVGPFTAGQVVPEMNLDLAAVMIGSQLAEEFVEEQPAAEAPAAEAQPDPAAGAGDDEAGSNE